MSDGRIDGAQISKNNKRAVKTTNELKEIGLGRETRESYV